MTCEDFRDRLSALIDGELSPEEAAAARGHAAACEDCRAAEADLRVLDAHLRSAFAADRRRAAAVAEAALNEPTPMPRRRSLRGVAGHLAAAAAGFVVATLLRTPPGVVPPGPAAVEATPPAAARLVYFTGEVGVRASPDVDWRSVAASDAADCSAGGSVRTGPGVLCEVQTGSGGVLRMNGDSEVKVLAANSLEVVRGEVWCRAAESPLRVAAAAPPAEAAPAVATFTCPTDTASLFSCQPPAAAQVTAADGEVGVSLGEVTTTLPPGRVLTLSGGGVRVEPEPAELVDAERWMLPLIARPGHDGADLRRRVDRLLAGLPDGGAESELRTLGPLAAPLLLDRLRDAEMSSRRKVMTIAADTAASGSVPELVGLLEDADAEVRRLAAEALARVTGETLGRTPGQWRDATDAAAVARWRAWWRANRRRCVPARQPPT